MGVLILPETEIGKELLKWEKPYRFVPYPRMLYKAFVRETGKAECMTGEPSPFGWTNPQEYSRACDLAAAFSRRCQVIAQDEDEYRRAKNDGWCDTPQAALFACEAQQQAIGDAAAEAAYAARRLSGPAQAELAAAEAATHEHVTDVPRPPSRSHKKRVPEP